MLGTVNTENHVFIFNSFVKQGKGYGTLEN